ncbi:MAG: cell division protein ZapA [Burkholderiales bacterium]
MRQVEVQIMGHGYVLGVPDGGESRVQSAVRRVDAAMCRIRDAGKLKARDRIAVLAALNLAFDLADRDGAAAAAPQTHSQSVTNVGTPAVAAIAAAPAASATTSTASASAAADSAPDPRLSALVARLDAALGEDGHLL